MYTNLKFLPNLYTRVQAEKPNIPYFEDLVNNKQLRKNYTRFQIIEKKSQVIHDRWADILRNNRYRTRQDLERIKQEKMSGTFGNLKRVSLRPDEKYFKYENAIGVEIECISSEMIDEKRIPFYVRAGSDGSVNSEENYPVEHEYRFLSPRDKLEKRLHTFCQFLRESDHKVNKSCGLHVHFDFRHKTYEEVRKIAMRTDKWLQSLKELVPLSRRENAEYCKFGVCRHDRYRAVNLSSHGRYKTLEIRLHSGTIDYTKMINWIRLIEVLFQTKRAPKKINKENTLGALYELPLAKNELYYWMNRHRALNPLLYANTPRIESE